MTNGLNMVSVVIVNYNTFDITAKCIQSIYRYTKNVLFEIVLVDNASTDVPADRFKEMFPEIVLVKSAANLGFAKGNNLGIAHSKGDFILLLNSDVYLVQDAISSAYHHYLTLIHPGILGVKMFFPDGRLQFTARRFRSITWEVLDVFRFFVYILPYPARAKIMLGKYFRGDFNINVDWLNGAFLFFRKEILSELPGNILDERFFMYGEDHLWCWQIKALGYQNFFYSGTSIVHINNASTDPKKRLHLLRIMFKNELEIMRYRKGAGLYFFLFLCIYGAKENFRIFYKNVVGFFKSHA